MDTGWTLSTLRPGISAAPPRVGVIMAGGEEDESAGDRRDARCLRQEPLVGSASTTFGAAWTLPALRPLALAESLRLAAAGSAR
ncbi:MAG: hypothetical protein DME17_10590 [Candidatus Rokuibacteriota bacterium]|nr:MAG: hypothetical protein DME17_10590 [Candidatus Rokubacteria bacterium]PYN06636.1 MAG: hypothetical protein DME06_18240 [Candidatus Rokubacteria bacterium]